MPDAPSSLAASLARAAREFAGEQGVEPTLASIVTAAVAAVPGSDFGGVSLLSRRERVVVQVQSDPVIAMIDQIQNDLHQGPCLAVLTTLERVVSTDLATDSRWPEFATAIAALEVRSALSLRLHLTRTTGTLSLFARRSGAFTSEAEVIADLFATHAAIALAGAQREQDMSRAMRHRDVVGVAKGLVMAWYRLSEQDAFTTLVRISQTENLKLNDVAARLVDQAEPPAAGRWAPL